MSAKKYIRKSSCADGMKNTKCWHCKNAVPSVTSGCSWSREFKPVEGWDALENKLNLSIGKCIVSYEVHGCPEFEKG